MARRSDVPYPARVHFTDAPEFVVVGRHGETALAQR